MANFLKGEVPLVLADKRKLTLVFDMDALIEAEAAYGKPMHQVTADASKGFMGATRALVFGALQARHPEMTLKDAADILGANTMAITEALTRALDQSMPEPAPSAPGNDAAPAAKRQPGKTSGANGAEPASTRTRSGA
jgi:hypothetical protein